MSEPKTDLEKLEVLVGAPRKKVVTITDDDGVATTHTVVIRRVQVGRIPHVILSAGGLMMYLQNPQEKLNFRKLMLIHSNDCLNLLAALLKKDRDFVDQLEPEEAILLLVDLVELNIDFFVRRVLPLFSEALRTLSASINEHKARLAEIIGQPSSSSSLSMDIESEKS